MQQPPIFQTTCKDGQLFVDQLNISVIAPFNKLVWSIPRNSVANVIPKYGLLMAEVEIHSAYGVYTVKTLPKPKANEFAALLAQHDAPVRTSQQASAQPTGILIDAEIQRVKLEIEQRRLQLRQVGTNMANVRSHYQQSHVHGGGKLGGVVRDIQRSGKDARLRKQQPVKERLQREKLALEQQLNHLKILKEQGITHITPSRKTK